MCWAWLPVSYCLLPTLCHRRSTSSCALAITRTYFCSTNLCSPAALCNCPAQVPTCVPPHSGAAQVTPRIMPSTHSWQPPTSGCCRATSPPTCRYVAIAGMQQLQHGRFPWQHAWHPHGVQYCTVAVLQCSAAVLPSTGCTSSTRSTPWATAANHAMPCSKWSWCGTVMPWRMLVVGSRKG